MAWCVFFFIWLVQVTDGLKVHPIGCRVFQSLSKDDLSDHSTQQNKILTAFSVMSSRRHDGLGKNDGVFFHVLMHKLHADLHLATGGHMDTWTPFSFLKNCCRLYMIVRENTLQCCKHFICWLVCHTDPHCYRYITTLVCVCSFMCCVCAVCIHCGPVMVETHGC